MKISLKEKKFYIVLLVFLSISILFIIIEAQIPPKSHNANDIVGPRAGVQFDRAATVNRAAPATWQDIKTYIQTNLP